MLEYPELGMEAVWKIEVEDFPAFIVVDDRATTSSEAVSGGGVDVPVLDLKGFSVVATCRLSNVQQPFPIGWVNRRRRASPTGRRSPFQLYGVRPDTLDPWLLADAHGA